MPEEKRAGVSRRFLFKLSGTVAAATALLGKGAKTASAHDLKPNDPTYRYSTYEAIVNRRDANIRMVFQWPNLKNEIMFPNVRNALNGYEFSYGIPASSVQVVVQAYASANAATYDDFIWEKYQLGERMGITDPETGEPAVRNIWYTSSAPADDVTSPPEDRDHAYYADTSIQGLQRRGVLVLI